MATKKSTHKKKATKKKPTKKRAAKRKAAKKSMTGSDKEREICFTIMPFGGWLDEYYETIYCPAIEGAGLAPHRADDLFRPGTIVTDIWDYTKRAKLLLADLTGKNPNVFYELGLAHALKKPAILVAESMDDIPFDLRALRIIIYDKNARWGSIACVSGGLAFGPATCGVCTREGTLADQAGPRSFASRSVNQHQA